MRVYACHMQAVYDFQHLEGFQWDPRNARKGADKHRVRQSGAPQVFRNQSRLVVADERHSVNEG